MKRNCSKKKIWNYRYNILLRNGYYVIFQSKSMELESVLRQLHTTNEMTASVSNISFQSLDGPKEGWLELPSGKGAKHGWVKRLVVLCGSQQKLFFYAGEQERKLNKPHMIIDLEKVSTNITLSFPLHNNFFSYSMSEKSHQPMPLGRISAISRECFK